MGGLGRVVEGLLGVVGRKGGGGGFVGPIADPTEPTIQLLAAAIRMSWSPDEEYKRRVTRCDYIPPDAAPVNVRNLYGVPRGR